LFLLLYARARDETDEGATTDKVASKRREVAHCHCGELGLAFPDPVPEYVEDGHHTKLTELRAASA
jgi:hypothetical protein